MPDLFNAEYPAIHGGLKVWRKIMQLRKDDKGVSPVVGVILMVAITVILAAVIAAFVLGQSGVTSTPSASIVIDTVTTGAGIYWINLSHQGGASIYLKDVRIIINDKTTLTQRVFDPVTTNQTVALSAGDKISLDVDAGAAYKNYGSTALTGLTSSGVLVSWSVGDELNIQIVYKPSNNFIADLTKFA